MLVGTADPESYDSRTLNDVESQKLRSLGFDPRIPVYDVEALDFDIEDVKRALFDSDYSKPYILTFVVPDTDAAAPDGSTDVPMAVELVQASYESYERHIDGIGVGRFESPEYYLRGYMYTQGGDRTIPMHVFLRVGERNQFTGAIVQIVLRPSGDETPEPIHYGRPQRPGA